MSFTLLHKIVCSYTKLPFLKNSAISFDCVARTGIDDASLYSAGYMGASTYRPWAAAAAWSPAASFANTGAAPFCGGGGLWFLGIKNDTTGGRALLYPQIDVMVVVVMVVMLGVIVLMSLAIMVIMSKKDMPKILLHKTRIPPKQSAPYEKFVLQITEFTE